MSPLKNFFISLAIGTTLTILFFFITDGNSDSPFFFLLWPGAFLADAARLGAHDAMGLLLFFFGNLAFYFGIPFFIFSQKGAALRKPPAETTD
jgi:hypothetical protein